jgi:LPS export ABC transporter protein LptC
MRHPKRGSVVLYAACRLLGAAVILLLGTIGCEEKIKPSIEAVAIGHDVPTQESWSAKITFTDSGKVAAILQSGHIAVYPEKRYTLLDSNIVVDFFDENECHTSVLTASRGKVDDGTHDFEAHGNVVVTSDSGTVLKTEDLYWVNLSQRIHTPSYVEIISPTEKIQGQGFESDKSLKQYVIFKVTGQAKTNE